MSAWSLKVDDGPFLSTQWFEKTESIGVPKHDNLDALIRNLTEVQKDTRIEELLEAALAEPQPTGERLRQIEQALETFKALGLFNGDDPRNLHLLLNLGRAYEQLNHFERAQETYQAALGLARQHNDMASQAELFSRVGRMLAHWQRWEEALAYFDRSWHAFGELGDRKGQAGVAVKRGVVFSQRGDYQAATAAYEQALGLGQQAGDKKSIVKASNNLAILATIRGDREEAIARYEECLVGYREIEDTRGLAGAYHNLGMTHADLQNWTSAMDCYERGFEVAQKHDHLGTMANIHLSMAEVLLQMGNSLMVPLCCARALDIYRKTGDHLGEAETYRLLGNTFAMRKEWETAAGLFEDSLRLNEAYGDPLNVAETQRDVGKMHMAQGHTSKARDAFKTALEGFRKLGAKADVAEVEALINQLGTG